MPAALLALAVTLLYTAWLGDDCYFTLRTVRNFLAGEGLRWNLFERVQAYTHPLWMLALSAAQGLTGEHYLTTLALAMACSLAASGVLLGARLSEGGRGLVAVLLLLSRAFVDYGTSGLENPLSFLLAALFLRELLREERTPASFRRLALWAGLASVTRLDTLLLYAPALGVRLVHTGCAASREGARTWARAAGALAIGFAPLVAWELFSCFYYGFPFPNTAYAKLGTGIPRGELAGQGLYYLIDSLRRDPPTLLAIGAACALALARDARRLGALAAGILLYLAYVVSIGGDFMSGRFLSLPFFFAAGVLGTRPLSWSPRAARAALLAAFVLGLHLHQVRLVFSDAEPMPLGLRAGMDEHGIDDERFCYYREMGLLRPGARFQPEALQKLRVGPEGVYAVTQGRQAFQAGREAIALETWGLADPLLARLPARFSYCWRIGHFERLIPRGYEKSLASGEDQLEDRSLAEFNRRLRLVTAGPLLSLERLRTALELNLGRHDDLVRERFYRLALRRRGSLVAGSQGRLEGRDALGRLPVEGSLFDSEHELRVGRITVALDAPELGAVLLVKGEEIVDALRADAPGPDGVFVLDAGGRAATGVWLVPARGKHPDVVRLELEEAVR